jgi:ATP-dependent 26S proteasome regulatory subunit
MVQNPSTVVFELRRLASGTLIHSYITEGAALAFIRDVIRVAGRDQAAGFALEKLDERGAARALASGPALVQRALEDRAE